MYRLSLLYTLFQRMLVSASSGADAAFFAACILSIALKVSTYLNCSGRHHLVLKGFMTKI